MAQVRRRAGAHALRRARREARIPDARPDRPHRLALPPQRLARTRDASGRRRAHGVGSKQLRDLELVDRGGVRREIASYWLQISKFLEYYAPEQLRLFELRELNAEPRRVVRELCEWVGVDAAFDHPGLDSIHHSSSDKGRPTPLGRRIQEYPGGRAVRTVFSRWLEEPLPKPVLAPETREHLREQLAQDVAALREFWGRDLADWSV